MAKNDLTKKTPAELIKELDSLKLELIKLNAQATTGASSKEAGRIRSLKKQIARIKTIQNNKEENQ